MTLATASDNDLLRQKTLETARRHKASWIELGQMLFAVHKDKHFKTWGFLSFETYCVKELGMKAGTVSKLIKSYAFLEKEEPRVVDSRNLEDGEPSKLPNLDSVHMLRLVKENQKLPPQDYAEVRESVITKAKDPQEVREQVKRLLEENDPSDPEEARKQRRNAAIKRILTVFNMARRELEKDGMIPKYLIQQMNDLASKLQDQVE